MGMYFTCMAGVLCFAYSCALQGGPRSLCFIIVLGRYHFAGSHRYSLKCSSLHAIMIFMGMVVHSLPSLLWR